LRNTVAPLFKINRFCKILKTFNALFYLQTYNSKENNSQASGQAVRTRTLRTTVCPSLAGYEPGILSVKSATATKTPVTDTLKMVLPLAPPAEAFTAASKYNRPLTLHKH
jgi:hypothetical protein